MRERCCPPGECNRRPCLQPDRPYDAADLAAFPKRGGFALVAAPLPEWGKVVSMIEFNGTIFVACEFMVAKLSDGKLQPIMWVAGQ